ncbi:MAG: DEAD/DEAH box helicase [Methanomicrobiaceae archaeon]|nr:DEAD/DEAH box helicase [Methanomicrobiaceae archaeon]
MNYIQHPLIRPERLEEREYQLAVAMRALEGNTMVVLPTGLGKTAVALLVAASRLHNTGGRILMLAPTKPLVEQHLRFFKEFLEFSGEYAMFTGEAPVEERTLRWKEARIVFATPQVIKNDVLAGRYDLSDVALLIVDECHRAVGNYAYVFIGHHYRKVAADPLLLAITASPGSDPERVAEVCDHLGIGIVETRTEDDADVRPYVHEKDVQFITVDLPPPLQRAVDLLGGMVESRLSALQKLGYPVQKKRNLSIKMLNGLNAAIQRRIQQKDASAYNAASIYAECMKLRHGISLAESQGSKALKMYVEKLLREAETKSATRAGKRLVADPRFSELAAEASGWSGELHPKLDIIARLVRIQLDSAPDSRVIIFATYRDTVQLLTERLTAEGISCERFVGQASKDTERGLSQKKQLEILQRFREGELEVLIATSVGEEGLDVPSTDLVVFYEAVPSEIRSIQRKGRTGRHGSGRIVVLVTRGTSDEAFRYVSQNRERAMLAGVQSLRERSETVPQPALPSREDRQTSIDAFAKEGPSIIADDRETSSGTVAHLHSLGAAISVQRLAQGDYAIGDRILVERKTTRDFMDTLINRDLLGQIRAISSAVPRPVLIIEGEDLYHIRNIHPNAIRGMLAALAIDLGVSVFFTASARETGELLFILARREEEERSERSHHPRKTYRSEREQQEYILSAFPSIGLKTARLLLGEFGSLQEIMNAERDDLTRVRGVGKKSADAIFELARKEYRE